MSDCRCGRDHPRKREWKHHTPGACGRDDAAFQRAVRRAERRRMEGEAR